MIFEMLLHKTVDAQDGACKDAGLYGTNTTKLTKSNDPLHEKIHHWSVLPDIKNRTQTSGKTNRINIFLNTICHRCKCINSQERGMKNWVFEEECQKKRMFGGRSSNDPGKASIQHNRIESSGIENCTCWIKKSLAGL